jgi:hypothetical protein
MAATSTQSSSTTSPSGDAESALELPIDDPDRISRLMFARPVPPAIDSFVLLDLFEFRSNKERPEYDRVESLVWRKVVVEDAELNAMGCAKQVEDNAKGKPTLYRGSRTSTAGAVRSKKSKRGHSFEVFHFPSEGKWHLHVKLLIAPEAGGYTKADRSDVRALMEEAFEPLAPHTCAA